MSHKRYLVELNSEERTYLKQLTSSGAPPRPCPGGGPRSGCSATRGPEGPAWTDEQAAEAVGVTAMTVYRARQALVREGMEAALQRKPRPPVPPKLGRGGPRPSWPGWPVRRRRPVVRAGR